MGEDGGGLGRNFRSAYYEKLGFCGNEEKNILDLLLSSSSFDAGKLSDLSERFDIDRRCVDTWKVLLEVDCVRKNPFDEFSNVRRVREEHFQSLKHHLEVLLQHNLVIKKRLKQSSRSSAKPLVDQRHLDENCRDQQEEEEGKDGTLVEEVKDSEATQEIGDENNKSSFAVGAIKEAVASEGTTKQQKLVGQTVSSASPSGQIVLMYLLEMGRLDYSDIDAQLNSLECRRLAVQATFFVNISRDLQEAFFLFRNFTKKLEENGANAANKSQPTSVAANNKKAHIL